jgi:sulfur-carrier protein
MQNVRILYFAWLKDRLGQGEEQLEIPGDIGDVAGLRRWMRGRGPLFEQVFADGGRVRAAVNQDFATDDARIAAGDEIAFFPPVTGG